MAAAVAAATARSPVGTRSSYAVPISASLATEATRTWNGHRSRRSTRSPRSTSHASSSRWLSLPCSSILSLGEIKKENAQTRIHQWIARARKRLDFIIVLMNASPWCLVIELRVGQVYRDKLREQLLADIKLVGADEPDCLLFGIASLNWDNAPNINRSDLHIHETTERERKRERERERERERKGREDWSELLAKII